MQISGVAKTRRRVDNLCADGGVNLTAIGRPSASSVWGGKSIGGAKLSHRASRRSELDRRRRQGGGAKLSHRASRRPERVVAQSSTVGGARVSIPGQTLEKSI